MSGLDILEKLKFERPDETLKDFGMTLLTGGGYFFTTAIAAQITNNSLLQSGTAAVAVAIPVAVAAKRYTQHSSAGWVGLATAATGFTVLNLLLQPEPVIVPNGSANVTRRLAQGVRPATAPADVIPNLEEFMLTGANVHNVKKQKAFVPLLHAAWKPAKPFAPVKITPRYHAQAVKAPVFKPTPTPYAALPPAGLDYIKRHSVSVAP